MFAGSVALSLALVGSLAQPAGAADGFTEKVSISSTGQQGNNISGRFAGPAINGDGSVVAFDSIATTLVPGDRNQEADVFVRDRTRHTTERVSVSTTGGQGDDDSTRPDLDAEGRMVAFDSSATNLVPKDTNHALDVFVHDRSTGITERVSVSSNEAQGNAQSHSPSISADGRYVAFVSTASNLVSNDTNGVEDIFVRDLLRGTTERVSLTSAGRQANSSTTAVSIGADGRWVAFSSFATNLVPNDTNGHFDSFVHDRLSGLTEIVSVNSDEEQGDAPSTTPSVNEDGNLVAFISQATNLVPDDTNDRPDIFVRNRATGTTERVSVSSNEEQGDGNSPEPGVRGFTATGPDITPDGRFVAFFSSSTNLVPGDTNTCPLFFEDPPGACPDAFVRDLVAGTTERWNVATDGSQANDRSSDAVISDDGTTVAFFSAASNLVADDTNICPPLFDDFPGQCPDIFVRDQGAPGSENADLSVIKSDARDPVEVGQDIRYNVDVTNQGPALATGVTVIDRLPEGGRLVSATPSAGTCADRDRTVVCALGALAAGETAAVIIEVRAMEAGTLTNSVAASAAQPDPVAPNNRDSETTEVLPA
jgi:uncharacterized repeat protein (TIGR01451 family)